MVIQFSEYRQKEIMSAFIGGITIDGIKTLYGYENGVSYSKEDIANFLWENRQEIHEYFDNKILKVLDKNEILDGKN